MALALTLTRLFLRLLATKARLLGLGALSLGMVLLAIVVRNDVEPVRASWQLFSLYALGGLVPISSLVVGASAFGDLIDDRTLVYLWLRPVSRPVLLLSAWLATVILVIPFAVIVPTVALEFAGMSTKAMTTSAFSALLGTLAYSAVFVALGLKLPRALAWGLAYILIWEGAVANAGAGLAKLALRLSTRSIAFRAYAGTKIRYPLATGPVVIFLGAVTIVALILGVRWLRNAEVA